MKQSKIIDTLETYQLRGGGADGPQHGLELVVPAPATGLELLLEGPSLEPP